MPVFQYATDDEIKSGETTDVYFLRTREILKAKGLDRVKVVVEVTTGHLPNGWSWGVLCGIEEVAHLLEGCPVDVDVLPEGTVFHSQDMRGIRIPVMVIRGAYSDFAVLDTALLGLVCQASGIATASARIKKIAGDRLILSFGVRRMHPAISPMIDRSAYIGGCDRVSCVLAAKRLGVEPSGTMPHTLVILFGDQVKAWKAFDEVVSKDVPRVALVDTYYDEKAETLMAAEALGDRLWGVRLDTPGSRRGSIEDIIREVRWELGVRGYGHVKIIVSGGLNEESVRSLSEAGADGFGVGTWISDAPTVDFSFDIVEVEGRGPSAKRGKYGGRKDVWRCSGCFADLVTPSGQPPPKCPNCGLRMSPMLEPLIRNGKVVAKLPKPGEIRKRVLNQVAKVQL